MRGSGYKTVRLQAWLVVAALLFTQFVTVAQACVLPTMAPAMVLAGDGDAAPCGGMSGNACFMQFLQADQTVDAHAGFVIAPPPASTPTIAFHNPAQAIWTSAIPLAHGSGAPLRTLLCRLLN